VHKDCAAEKGVADISGASPRHSPEPALYSFIDLSAKRMSSSKLSIAMLMLSMVSTGWSKDRPTEALVSEIINFVWPNVDQSL
jgi:hypothetical protein